ncbi:hypothetical protein, partial [Corynebacterium glyciniphilum]|uniref:hypothetical protein n=1 Tax=Corynebacterium glyciniphilum TaxID=1404244 RepID=UPI001C92D745
EEVVVGGVDDGEVEVGGGEVVGGEEGGGGVCEDLGDGGVEVGDLSVEEWDTCREPGEEDEEWVVGVMGDGGEGWEEDGGGGGVVGVGEVVGGVVEGMGGLVKGGTSGVKGRSGGVSEMGSL